MLNNMFNVPKKSGKKKKISRGICLLAIGMALIAWIPKPAMANQTHIPFKDGVISTEWQWQKPVRDSYNMRVVGRSLFGPCRRVCIKDNIAYTIFGNTLMIFDAADISNPTLLGYYDEACLGIKPLSTGQTQHISYADVWVVDSLAYVSGDGFTIFNISDPSSVQEVGHCDSISGSALYIVDTLAYIVNGDGFKVINISNPTFPYVEGQWSGPNSLMTDIKVVAGVAYVLGYYSDPNVGNLFIVDVSDPSNPQLISDCNPHGNGFTIYAEDSLVYMGGYNLFDIVNVSDPLSPQTVYSSSLGTVFNIYVVDTLAYVLNDGGMNNYELNIFNVSNPSSPQLVSEWHIGGGRVGEIFVEDGFAYLAGWEGGFQILDVSDPLNVYEISCYDNTGNTSIYLTGGMTGLCVKNSIAYIPSWVPYHSYGQRSAYIGMYIVNIVDPSSPSIMGYSHEWDPSLPSLWGDPGYPASGIEVVDDIAYLAEFTGGLVITDVSDPSSPYVLSSYWEGIDGIIDVDVEANFAYTAHWWGSYIYDVSDLYSPVNIGLFNSRAIDVEVQDTIAYLANIAGLEIYSVSDPHNPHLLSTLGLSSATGVFVQDTLVYVARADNGVSIINASDITSPVEVGNWDKDGFSASNLYVSNNIAFVAGGITMGIHHNPPGSPGIWVLDVSEPTAPVDVGYYGRISPCRVTGDGTYVYAVGYGTGLWILEYTAAIIGDFNSDGYVDATDFQMIGDHWHFTNTHPDWDPLYDLVPDNIIDASDLQVFGDHWHEGTPPKSDSGGKSGKGPNADAGIVFDLDATTSGNQNLTSIPSQPAGTYIPVDVYCTGVSNLDTYEFEVIYDPTELSYISSSATNPITFEPNILTTNGGEALGWMVDSSTPGVLSIAYTLAGDDPAEAPEGEGLIADIVFQALVNTHGTLSFGDVYFYDSYGVVDLITDTGTATLPVELAAFTATYVAENGYTSIYWATASETDVNGFNIYRNTDDDFGTATKINADLISGHGTTSEPKEYSFIDDNPVVFETTYYYWLESIDFGGETHVYASISLTPEEGEGGFVNEFDKNMLTNYPNPFSGSTTIEYGIKGRLKAEPVEIRIYNVAGQLIETIKAKNGKAKWNVDNLPTGVYFYQLKTENYNEVKKMLLVQ